MKASFLLQQAGRKPAIKHITRKQLKIKMTSERWSLVLILALQAIIAETTLHNTAFQDEGLYLYAGRQIIRYWMGGPAPLENYAFYFSGYPYVYPVIGGFLDMLGGLELARTFSLLCMLSVNAIIYHSTKRFFGRPAAIFASAIYASLGTVMFVSRLATFDALCLFLIALATAIAFQVSTSRRPWIALLIGPLIVLSILAKYAALLFDLPVLGILVLCGIAFQGWWRMLQRLALSISTLIVSLLLTYAVLDKSAFHALDGSTTDRTAVIQKPPLELLLHVLQMGGLVYVAGLAGVVLVFWRYQRFRLIAVLLFGASWLGPAYHIYKQEAVSIDKHIAFSLFFLMPLVGASMAWVSGYAQQQARSRSTGHYWLAGLSVVLVVFTLGTQQAQTLYAEWANTSDLSYALHTQMRDGSGRFLVEDIEVARYDARDITEMWQWNGVNYFYYVNAAHQQLLGNPALKQAIDDRYFALVELSFIYQPAEAYFIAQQMAISRNYDLIDKVFFQNSFGTGHFYLWRSAAVAGQGNFTSLSQVQM
jgi:hypothetical protein